MKVIYSNKAEKGLKRIPQKYKDRIIRAIASLADKPLAGRPLTGELEGRYKLVVWPYRVIYRLYAKEQLVYIVTVGHRQGVYK